ncbi:expressed unknown protein [Seminavis robusta]|uniref:CRAL-TRIO domain-containing protein n=1 Tax=Seminavis robusta TaxID=568900 RepID=A0A9N8EIF0_9STRA|nr:expressed unknown protein [Seminavis robusta]|eukprot:Sro1130_g244440.1 n/a (121) ;mRNA; r:2153-2515
MGEGKSVLAECDGVGHGFLHPIVTDMIMQLLIKGYPMNLKHVISYNTPTVVNIWWSLMKKIVPKHLQRRFHLGCHPEILTGIRLDALYKVRTEEKALLKMIWNVGKQLQVKKKNEEGFNR